MSRRRVAGFRREPAALLHKEDGGRVAVVSLNRPRVLNAYGIEMRDALYEALLAVRDDPEVRVMVLRGNGPAFSTGGDLREFGSAPSPYVARSTRWRRDVWGVLWSLPQITVAAVHGFVVGGGFEMALLCDHCIAARDARFRLPETGLGMIPGVGGTQTLPRLIGAGRAADLVLTGRWLDAREARRLGIAARVVAPARLRAAAAAWARRAAALEPALVSALKRAVNDGLDMCIGGGLACERRLAVARETRLKE
jgi:enoyl-CoA hydratase